MAGERIATRYASALFELAESIENAREYLSFLTEISKVFDDESISKVLRSPVVKADLKGEVLRTLGRQVGVNDTVKFFLDALAEGGRVALLPVITDRLKALIYEKTGTQEASIVTAVEISDSDLADIKTKLDQITGKQNIVTQEIDPSILGGFVIRIENSVLDMSLKSKLDAITQTAVS